MENSGSIQDVIVSHINELSPTLRRAAEFVAAHPEEVATRTLSHVAKTSDLEPPTFSRLARALGCEKYDDLREICRGELKRRNRVLADKADALLQLSSDRSPGQKSGIFYSQASSVIDNIRNLMETVDPDILRSAAEALAQARTVLVLGSSSGGASASYFLCMARMAFDNWRMSGSNGLSWSAEVANLGPEDAVFLISTQPYGNMVVRSAQAAKDAGAKVIVVTDSLNSPFGPLASHYFIIGTNSPQFFPSHVAAIVLVESLMGMVVRRCGKRAAEHIQEIEAMGHTLGEYWAR